MIQSGNGRIFLTVFLGFIAAMAPLATDMYLPSLPEMMDAFGTSASVVQLTLTVTILGMAIGQVAIGPLSDRYGRRMPLIIGMLVFALTSYGAYLTSDITLFLVMRFLQGFSGASGIVISRAIARDVCEGPELTRFFAILMMVNGLAPILAPVVGGQILLFSTWRMVFVVLTLVGLFLALESAIYRETLPVKDRITDMGASFRKFPQLLHDRYFIGHCLVQCFTFGGFFSYLAGSSFLFQSTYGASPQLFSLIFSGIGVGLIINGYLPARLAGRVKDVTMLHLSLASQFIASLLFLASIALHAPLIVVFLTLFFTIIPMSVLGAASFSLALARQGKNAGSASALLGFAQMVLGASLMPLVGIAGAASPLPMPLIMSTCFFLSLVCYAIFIRPEHRKKAAR